MFTSGEYIQLFDIQANRQKKKSFPLILSDKIACHGVPFGIHMNGFVSWVKGLHFLTMSSRNCRISEMQTPFFRDSGRIRVRVLDTTPSQYISNI